MSSEPGGLPTDIRPESEFEFSESQNGLFVELSSGMRFVGSALFALGMVSALGGLAGLLGDNKANALGTLVQAVLCVLIGRLTRSAAASVGRVASTSGSDITNLVTALSELNRVYRLQKNVLVVALVFVVMAFGAGILVALAGGAR